MALVIASVSGLVVSATLVFAFIMMGRRRARLGLPVRIPFLHRVIGHIDLVAREFDIRIDASKNPNVVVHIVGNVQCFVLPKGRGILLIPSSGDIAAAIDETRNAIVKFDRSIGQSAFGGRPGGAPGPAKRAAAPNPPRNGVEDHR
jgi:hypothetical protein